MADIVVTAAKVGLVDPSKAKVKSYRAGSTVTKGQAIAITTTGTAVPADASTGGAHLIQFRGIALNGGGAGQAIDVVQEGEVYGFTISGLDVGALVYLSNSVGALADAAGDVTVVAGRVDALSDNGATDVLHVDVSWLTTWS